MNRYLIAAVAWVATLAICAWATWDYCSAKHAEDKLSAVERAVEQQRALDAETRDIELAAAEQEQQVKIVYRDRIKEVTKYVEATDRVQCFDDDGLRLFNRISAGVEDAGDGAVR